MNAAAIIKYGKYFTPARFFSFVKYVGKNLTFIRQAVLLFYVMKDGDTPKAVKAVIVGALGYLLLPADMVPDVVTGLGWLDDAAVIAMAMRVSESYIKPMHRDQVKQLIPLGK